MVVEMRTPTQSHVAAGFGALCTGLLLLFPFGLVFPLGPSAGWSIPHLDKIVHFGLFLVLVPLLGRSLAVWRRRGAPVAAFFAGSGYGVLLEVLQQWVPGRYVSLGDGVATVIGAACGAAWFVRSHRRG